MAGRNEVTLTFAGDADKLEKEVRRAADSTDGLKAAFDRVGAAAKGMDTSFDGVGKSTDRLNRVVGEGGRQFGDYGKGLGGVGDRFDEVDTRAMGLADGFAGITDAMRWNQLTAQEQAMVFSDMGSAMYNAVIPSLQSGVKSLKNFGTSLRNLPSGAKALGGVTVGLTAVAAGIQALNDKASESTINELSADFLATGDAAKTLEKTTNGVSFNPLQSGVRELVGAFDEALAQGPDVAQQWIDSAAASGVSKESLSRFQEVVDKTRESERGLAEMQGEVETSFDKAREAAEKFNTALQEQQDQQRALTDPLFAAVTATNDLVAAKAAESEAQVALNEALAAGDPAAIAEAQRGLEDAHLDVADAAYGEQAAQETLMGALATGQTTVADMRAQVDELERSGRLSGDAAGYLRDQINSVESKGVSITANIWNATQGIGTVQERLASLRDKRVQIDIAYTSYGVAEANRARAMSSLYAGGGVVYAQGGHPGMPRGTDTVPAWLTPGEMVLNKGQQANLFNAIDGGALGGAGQQVVVNVAVAGSIRSDRDLVKVIRDELARGGMRGTLR